VTEQIWETLDNLFKTTHRESRRVEQLEARVADLEQRLNEQLDSMNRSAKRTHISEIHTGRAA
jgi:hypothetical protein